MDTALGSIDESDELERLRERAYGPDADIAQDAAAQARLSELEAARRLSIIAPVPEVPRGGDAAPASGPAHGSIFMATGPAGAPLPVDAHLESGPGARLEEGAGPVTTSVGASAPAAAVAGAPTGLAATPWWRRRRWLAMIGGGVAAVLLVAAVVSSLAPRPDFVLQLQGPAGDEQEITDMNSSITWLGLDPEQLLRFEDFRGFRVWSGPTQYGTDCLIISRVDQGLAALGCSPAGLATIADLQRYSGVTDEVFADMPTGSMIRFVLDGDRVEVFLGEAEATAS
ncbi:hypothetical protein ACLQ2Q_10195 [Microbacterium sp. DT81.1]|uniref:hypothetical protein n=1 Tax=Microbacterium sp. DT81.1 TaxID=3393413 RepID=UPI003CE7C70B